jgi:VWFA-related protein
VRPSRVFSALSGAAALLPYCSLALAQVRPPTGDPDIASLHAAPQARVARISVVAPKLPYATNTHSPASAFQIVDDGVPQRTVPVSAARADVACQAPAHLPPVGAGTYTNCVGMPAGATGNLIVIVIDWTHVQPVHYPQVRKGIIGMLRQARPGDRVGVYSLSRFGFRVLHDCAMDVGGLLERSNRIHNTKQDLPKTTDGKTIAAATPVLPAAEQVRRFEEALGDPRTRGFLAARSGGAIEGTRALTFIAEHLSQFDVRKSVIWISGEFPMATTLNRAVKDQEFSPVDGTLGLATCRFLRTLSDGTLVIYPVDTSSADFTGQSSDVFEPGWSERSREGNETRVVRTRLHMARSISSQPSSDSFGRLKELAKFTGGRAYHNTKNFSRVMRSVINDASRAFSVSYAPQGHDEGGKLHNIRVRLNRSDAGIRHPSGYFDLPAHPRDAAARTLELNEVFNNPMDTSELRLYVHLQPHPQVAGARHARIHVEPSREGHQSNSVNVDRKMDVVFVEMSPGGRPRACQQLGLAADDARKDESARPSGGAMLLHRAFRCSPTARRVRVVVQDGESGALGSVTVPITEGQP